MLINICLLSACRTDTLRYEIYFIPKGYTGYVNIRLNDSSSSNKIIHTDNSYIYFITGNPARYSVRDKKPPAGSYIVQYYYYSPDSLKQLNVSINHKQYIFSEAMCESSFTFDSNNNVVGHRFKFKTFFVADKPYTYTEFFEKYNPLPENDWFEK